MKRLMSLYRFFEIIPGALTWTTLAVVVILSATAPVFMAIFIILFDVYWLLKIIYFSDLILRNNSRRFDLDHARSCGYFVGYGAGLYGHFHYSLRRLLAFENYLFFFSP